MPKKTKYGVTIAVYHCAMWTHCLACGADAGDLCSNKWGEPVNRPHKARLDKGASIHAARNNG
jgi:hypothetical protein